MLLRRPSSEPSYEVREKTSYLNPVVLTGQGLTEQKEQKQKEQKEQEQRLPETGNIRHERHESEPGSPGEEE